MLVDDRGFVLGTRPGWADILAYSPLWMRRGNIANAKQLVQDMSALAVWEFRVKAIGHGRSRSMSAAEAIEVARVAKSITEEVILSDTWPSRLAYTVPRLG